MVTENMSRTVHCKEILRLCDAVIINLKKICNIFDILPSDQPSSVLLIFLVPKCFIKSCRFLLFKLFQVFETLKKPDQLPVFLASLENLTQLEHEQLQFEKLTRYFSRNIFCNYALRSCRLVSDNFPYLYLNAKTSSII